jgi:hypothetical protein
VIARSCQRKKYFIRQKGDNDDKQTLRKTKFFYDNMIQVLSLYKIKMKKVSIGMLISHNDIWPPISYNDHHYYCQKNTKKVCQSCTMMYSHQFHAMTTITTIKEIQKKYADLAQ